MNEHSIPPVHLLEDGARAQIEQAETRYRHGLADAFAADAKTWWFAVDAHEKLEGETQ